MSKKILIVSDYIDSNLGWIESYIHQVKQILQNQWFEIKLVWYKVWKSRLKRLFFLFLSFFNIFGYFKLKKQIKQFNPDILRLHSVARVFWPLGILPIKNFKWKVLIMYHDLGYFHPFADKVEDIFDLVLPFTFKNWLNSLKWYSIFRKIYWILKFFKLYFLRKNLINYVDVHLVPSEFMIDILKNRWIEENKVKVLRHFILK